jgi:large conductance mechanosensitive channel
MKGNVVDTAVGIIIGVVFGKIVASLVRYIIMPPIGVSVGSVNIAPLAYVIQQAQGETATVAINYGLFIQSIVDFLIVAFAIFTAIKVMNSLKKRKQHHQLHQKNVQQRWFY